MQRSSPLRRTESKHRRSVTAPAGSAPLREGIRAALRPGPTASCAGSTRASIIFARRFRRSSPAMTRHLERDPVWLKLHADPVDMPLKAISLVRGKVTTVGPPHINAEPQGGREGVNNIGPVDGCGSCRCPMTAGAAKRRDIRRYRREFARRRVDIDVDAVGCIDHPLRSTWLGLSGSYSVRSHFNILVGYTN